MGLVPQPRFFNLGETLNEKDSDCRDGIMLDTADDAAIIAAIEEVGKTLAERSDHECWRDVIAETIADLPSTELD